MFLQCFSTWFLLLVSTDHPSATKALTPKKTRVSQKNAWRAACGHLHFLLLSSHWHKTRRAEGKAEQSITERLWETLWKVGFSLAHGVACHHVWSFLWFLCLPSRGLLLELDRDTWEVSRLLTTWRSRSVVSSGNKTQTKVTGLALPSTSGRRRQNNRVAPALVFLCSTWWKSSL